MCGQLKPADQCQWVEDDQNSGFVCNSCIWKWRLLLAAFLLLLAAGVAILLNLR